MASDCPNRHARLNSLEWHMLTEFINVLIHRRGFLRQEVSDRVSKAFVGNPVSRPSRSWYQTARHLMYALCAAFEASDAVFDAVFDCLDITGLEMQA